VSHNFVFCLFLFVKCMVGIAHLFWLGAFN